MKRWKCQVCGYVHEGPEPPEVCPVCNAGAEQFELEEDPARAETERSDGSDPSASDPAENENLRWRCTVCGYIHTGAEPPEICPVCNATQDKFTLAGDDEPQPVKAAAAAADRAGHDDPTAEYKAVKPPVTSIEESAADRAAPPVVAGGPEPPPPALPGGGKRWRCTVCNYLHGGPAPPVICPICGAGAKDFVADEDTVGHTHTGLGGLVERLHAHPITAHFPNAALPLALAFWVGYLILGDDSLERTSFYLLLVAAAAAPVTMYTGWSDARHRFGSADTGVFPEKKRWGGVLVLLAAGITAWRLATGWAWVPDTTLTIVAYTVLLAAANGLAIRLGMLGGKLIFGH